MLLMAIETGSAKTSDANLTSFIIILSIPGAEIHEFQDGFDFLKLYHGTSTGRRCRNGTGYPQY